MYVVYAYTIMHNHFRGLKTRPCMSAQCILQVADSLWYVNWQIEWHNHVLCGRPPDTRDGHLALHNHLYAA